jgi:hypothetical protein
MVAGRRFRFQAGISHPLLCNSLKGDLFIRLRPPCPFALRKTLDQSVVGPAQPLGIVVFPVAGHSLEKNGLGDNSRIRVLLNHARKTRKGIRKAEPVEEHFPLAELQVRQKIVCRDEAHDALMLLARGIVNQQGRRPADVELLHEIGSLVPKALALHHNKFFFQIAPDLFVGIRTRIHCSAADSAIEPEILKYGFVGFPSRLNRLLKVFLPIDRSHDVSPFWNRLAPVMKDNSAEKAKVTGLMGKSLNPDRPFYQ